MSGGSGPGAPVRRAVDLVELDGMVVSMPLTESQRDGRACVHCGATLSPSARVAGHVAGRPVWACTPSCDSSQQSPASLGDSAPAWENPPAPGPDLLSAPDARSGDSAFKDAWGLTDHQRPVLTADLSDPTAGWKSPSPPASTSYDRGEIPTAGRRVWQYLAADIAGWLLDRLVGLFTISVRFAGPLTAPSAAATAPAALEGPDPQQPAPASSAAGQLGGPDDNRFFPMAWDCLFDDEPGHYCVNSYGQPVRAGQSCQGSASVMSRRDFATRSPRLYEKAVALKIIEADKAVV